MTKHKKAKKVIVETLAEEAIKVRCPDCLWKAGLKDENTYCPTCEGHGVV